MSSTTIKIDLRQLTFKGCGTSMIPKATFDQNAAISLQYYLNIPICPVGKLMVAQVKPLNTGKTCNILI